jgi:hypothetical protein
MIVPSTYNPTLSRQKSRLTAREKSLGVAFNEAFDEELAALSQFRQAEGPRSAAERGKSN